MYTLVYIGGGFVDENNLEISMWLKDKYSSFVVEKTKTESKGLRHQ